MTFADTSGWYALFVADDPNHAAAADWVRVNRPAPLTTDYVIDETLTLMRARGYRQCAIDFGIEAFAKQLATVHYLTPADVAAAWDVFRDFDDKDWSFTDCASKVVIEQLNIATAFTFDHHFRQFGTVTVVP